MDAFLNIIEQTGFYQVFSNFGMTWGNLVMILISLLLLYLAIVKQFEPLLLLGIAFGMLLTNLPGANMYHAELWTNFMTEGHADFHSYGKILAEGGLPNIEIVLVAQCQRTALIPQQVAPRFHALRLVEVAVDRLTIGQQNIVFKQGTLEHLLK